ncbi:MAG: nitronate monooxygenase [Vicinamibacteria bacterium]
MRSDGGCGEPQVIQGGMGVAISGWRLARAVASLGQLGVVSGTALDLVLARRLQLGDRDGEMRKALASFPDRSLADEVLRSFFVPDGAVDGRPSGFPMFTAAAPHRRQALAVVGGFVEVFLAKQGHRGRVGINFLEKIQLPTPATLYGALLAGVDYVLVGAGIPRDIPALLDGLTRHEPVSLPLHVTGATPADAFALRFDPREVMTPPPGPLARPRFLAIVASATLAASLARHAGRVDGFVVEGPTAGGHNAPPRGPLQLDAEGAPVYGARDVVDLGRMRALGLPFWLAGSYASPERLREALAAGATGVQVGSLFAFCRESGLDPSLRTGALDEIRHGSVRVFTDPLASPTGFPFKVLRLQGTLSEAEVYESRPRRCDIGYLRELYRRADGTLGYRCPGEPFEDYLRKGGRSEDTQGRKCICNGLLATAGLGQRHASGPEPPIVTSGDDLGPVALLMEGRTSPYSAAEAIAYLVGPGVRERTALQAALA